MGNKSVVSVIGGIFAAGQPNTARRSLPGACFQPMPRTAPESGAMRYPPRGGPASAVQPGAGGAGHQLKGGNMYKFLGMILLGLIGLVPVVQAKELEVDFTRCVHGKFTMLEQSPELAVAAIEDTGIATANGSSKLLDKSTAFCSGYWYQLAGKRTGKQICKILDLDGDSLIVETNITGPLTIPHDNPLSFVAGTGKFKGAQGTAMSTTFAAGKPLQPGTYDQCRRVVGKVIVP